MTLDAMPADQPVRDADFVSDVRLAPPWARYWARQLDVVLHTVAIGLVLGVVVPQLFAFPLFQKPPGDRLLDLLFLPFALMLEALSIAAFGSSVGKLMVGVPNERWRETAAGSAAAQILQHVFKGPDARDSADLADRILARI
jgi:hypothetical protein